MPGPLPDEIAIALADALPRDADRRDELVAIGMVATALICGVQLDDRAAIVETFCSTLRKSVAADLN